MPATENTLAPQDVTLARLEDQIKWYGSRSKKNQTRFKFMKVITIVSAAVIPVLSTAGISNGARIVAGLGVLIAIVEGVQQLNQYQSNWTSYRSTSEALKHEKYLYLAKAGPYLASDNPQAILAERIEALISQETTKWVSSTSQKPPGAPPAPGPRVS